MKIQLQFDYKMALKVSVNHLNKDELMYELTVRGLDTGTVEAMRVAFTKQRNLEIMDDGIMETYPDSPYDDDEEEDICKAKIAEVKKLLGDLTRKDKRKAESKLWHCMGRIRRIDEDHEGRTALLTEAKTLYETFLQRCREFEKPAGLEILETTLNQALNLGSTPHHSTPNQSVNKPPAFSSTSGVKSIPVCKWNLKFSGAPGVSVNAFLERVDELKTARHVRDDMLLHSALDLFEDRALTWYRSVRRNLTSWTDLVEQLREEFQPPNYNEKLFDEIRRRTQGENESIGVYLANMNGLFGRLSCSMSEEAKLKILLDNLAPFYQNQLGLVHVTSVDHLRQLGKKLETRRQAVENFMPPPRRQRGLLEPDLACLSDGPESDLLALETPVVFQDVASGSRPKPVCWNCRRPGHLMSQCQQPRKIICHKCGTVGFTIRTCPECSQSGNGHRRM